MFGLGTGELVVIFIIALIVLGPAQLPKLAQSLGKAIREFRKAADSVKDELVVEDEVRKPFAELRDAMTLPADELRRRDEVKRFEAEHPLLAHDPSALESSTGGSPDKPEGAASISPAKPPATNKP